MQAMHSTEAGRKDSVEMNIVGTQIPKSEIDLNASDSQMDAQVTNDQTISAGRQNLRMWLNKQLKIEMTDGRILIGEFACTDRDANIILSSTMEYYNVEKTGITDEPRTLGLVMIPWRHVVSMHIDELCLPNKQ